MNVYINVMVGIFVQTVSFQIVQSILEGKRFVLTSEFFETIFVSRISDKKIQILRR